MGAWTRLTVDVPKQSLETWKAAATTLGVRLSFFVVASCDLAADRMKESLHEQIECRENPDFLE